MMERGLRPVPADGGADRVDPAIDVTNEDGNLVIHAELPGMKREDVDVASARRAHDLRRAQGGAGAKRQGVPDPGTPPRFVPASMSLPPKGWTRGGLRWP